LATAYRFSNETSSTSYTAQLRFEIGVAVPIPAGDDVLCWSGGLLLCLDRTGTPL